MHKNIVQGVQENINIKNQLKHSNIKHFKVFGRKFLFSEKYLETCLITTFAGNFSILYLMERKSTHKISKIIVPYQNTICQEKFLKNISKFLVRVGEVYEIKAKRS